MRDDRRQEPAGGIAERPDADAAGFLEAGRRRPGPAKGFRQEEGAAARGF
jgi:hypothetical protein